MKKYLITGCTGFVAPYFIEHLLEQDKNAEILGIATREAFSIDANNFQYEQLDMLDKEQLSSLFAKFQPDFIIHLAAISSVGQSWLTPVEAFRNNTNIFLNLVESVRVLKLSSRILSVGSSEVYKTSPHKALSEGDVVDPKSPYAVARISQEMISRLYAESYGLNLVMTRSFNHTGPKQLDNFVVSSFVKQLVEISLCKRENKIRVGNIEIVRDFLDVRDVVKAYYKILIHGKSGEIYNVSSGQGTKLRQLIELVSERLKISPEICVDPSKIRPSENMFIVGDNAKLKEKLQWEQEYTLSQTLDDIILYWKKELVK